MTFDNLTKQQRYLRKRILEISYQSNLSHLGSTLSCVDLIEAVYQIKKDSDKFVLSNGHAGIALYVVLEKRGILSEELIKTLNIHPDRNLQYGIHVSTGSLGQGLPIALGMAIGNRKINVYCCVSDGESTEGSIWESLRIAVDLKIDNLKIILNANGWGAYDPIPTMQLYKKLKAFNCYIIRTNGHSISEVKKALKTKVTNKPLLVFAHTIVNHFSFLKDQDAHYYVMREEDYKLALEALQ